MLCSLLIWLDNTVLSAALETLADPVRGLDAGPAELQWATGSYTLAFATLMFTAGALGRSLRSPPPDWSCWPLFVLVALSVRRR